MIGEDALAIKSGNNYYKTEFGAYWLLLFYHNYPKGGNFPKSSDALYSMHPYRYSVLSTLNKKHKINDEYEFLLEYPNRNGYNRWAQSLNPLEELETSSVEHRNATGYRPINCKFTGLEWGGLVKSNYPKHVLLDGSTYHSYVFYGIGSTSEWCDGLYGPDCVQTTVVFLWVRLSNRPFYHCSKHEIFHVSNIRLFLITFVSFSFRRN